MALAWFNHDYIGVFSLQELTLLAATVIQIAAVYQHFHLTRWSGWITPFQLYGAAFTLMIVGRIASQLGYYEVLETGWPRAIQTICFLIESILLVTAGFKLRYLLKRDIEGLKGEQ